MMSTKQTMKNKKDAIILLSGGLDCTVALAESFNNFNITLAITFDYGQKSLTKEIKSAKSICQFYNIPHKIIDLPWLKEITTTALVSDEEIPQNINLEKLQDIQESCKNVWIPNRNSLFLNIAAAHLDANNGGVVIIGANKEEAKTFSDNSQEFINNLNQTLKFSCQQQVDVIAPLINLEKEDIIKLAIKNNAPLELITSCYTDNKTHCGKCESCLRLKRALEKNNCKELIKKLFN